MIKSIIIPKYIKKGISKNHSGYPEKINILGCDTESKPYLIFGITDNVDYDIKECDKNNIHKIFLELTDKYTKKGIYNVAFFHNLSFDIQLIFLKFKEEFKNNNIILYFDKNYNRISAYKKDCIKIDIKHSKCNFAKIYFSKNKTLNIIDSFAFFKSSLSKLSYDLNLDHKKDNIWNENMNKEELKKYLINDIYTQYDLAKIIIDFHKKYNVRICVSIAQLASRIFRHKFLKKDDLLTFIPDFMIDGCQLSYHGGKNNYYLDKVTKLKNVYEYDIVSAYPYAMTQIPNFNHCKYEQFTGYHKDYIGVYCITGEIRKHKYPLFYTHSFRKLEDKLIKEEYSKQIKINSFKDLENLLLNNDLDIQLIDKKINLKENLDNFNILLERENIINLYYDGDQYGLKKDNITEFETHFYVKNLWVTSYELNIAKKYNLIDLESCYGYRIIEKPDTYNPLKAYNEYFFNLKQNTSKNDPNYMFYKILLNSLYGKFIQNIDYDREGYYQEDKNGNFEWITGDYKAGGLYNPMIATLITGFTRSQIYDYERKYQSLHTSTDSIKTLVKIPKKELNKSLGSLDLELYGDCHFLRNKVYLHYGDILKYATHGFHGKIEDLIRMIIEHDNEYEYEHMGKIKESLIRKDPDKQIIPCEMNDLNGKLNVKF